MSGAVSSSGPVGLFFMRSTDAIEVVESAGMWLITVPDGDRTRIVAQCEDKKTAIWMRRGLEIAGRIGKPPLDRKPKRPIRYEER